VSAAATQFYLYFADETSAEQAAERLREDGFTVSIGPGAYGPDWAALASRALADDELDETERRLGELAASLGGRCEGYDRLMR